MFWGLLAHGFGDYLLQSDWMALEKTTRWWPAWVHALTYGIPFLIILLFFGSPLLVTVTVLVVIVGTHVVIDRYRLVRYVVWVKNLIAPKTYRYPWRECQPTGYHKNRPPFMAVWLMIVADNCLHVLLNSVALSWALTVGRG